MGITIDEYIQRFNGLHERWSVSGWMHQHPKALKTLQKVGVLMVPLAIAALPAQIGYTAATLSLTTSLGSWLFLRHVTCAHHSMEIHAYTEKKCLGGKLYYRGDIPVLELLGKDPKQWGYAHGFLLGAEIDTLKKNLDLAVHSLLRLPRAPQLANVLTAIRQKTPSAYLEEMEGLSDGFNAWAKQEKKGIQLSVDDLLLMHLIPDSKHFHPKELEKIWKTPIDQEDPQLSVACTSVLDRDDQGHVILGRNMDWCPFGKAGEKSLILVWKDRGVAVLGVPGMIGAVTGWNKHKMALAMNVCPGKTTDPKGMPAILFNRHILESATDVSTAHHLFQQKKPLGPYHLTLADPHQGACISFYQEDGNHHTRPLKDRHIEVLNWEYPKCEGGFFNSQHRHHLLTSYFEGAKHIPGRHPKLMENGLRLAPYVNSWITMHSLLFRPAEDKVQMSWDNGYAASNEKIEASLTGFFDHS